MPDSPQDDDPADPADPADAETDGTADTGTRRESNTDPDPAPGRIDSLTYAKEVSDTPVVSSPHELQCHGSCNGETRHRFLHWEDYDDEEALNQPVWECRRCEFPRHGPIPAGHPKEFPTDWPADEPEQPSKREFIEGLLGDAVAEKDTGSEQQPSAASPTPELVDVVVEYTGELDEGEGASGEAVLQRLVEDHDVDAILAGEAIWSALFSGRCYQSDSTTLKVAENRAR